MSVPAATRGRAEMEAAYRFFDNDKVSPEKSLRPHIEATRERISDRVVWFENVEGSKWSQHVIRTDFRAANQVILADLNGDGRLDIVASADDGSRRVQGTLEVRWWRNEGP